MSINKFKPGKDRAQINKVIPLHREWAKKQLAAGVLVQAGKWGDNGGMIVVKAESREEADKVVPGPARRSGPYHVRNSGTLSGRCVQMKQGMQRK